MLSPENERDLLLDEIIMRLKKKFPLFVSGIDERDWRNTDCEIFEIFFILNKNCQEEINPESVDGNIVLMNLRNQAFKQIIERVAELQSENHQDIIGIGLFADTDWCDDIQQMPEFEAMIGFPPNDGDLPVRWTFAVRFIAQHMYYTGRCKTKKIEISDTDFEIIKTINEIQ